MSLYLFLEQCYNVYNGLWDHRIYNGDIHSLLSLTSGDPVFTIHGPLG